MFENFVLADFPPAKGFTPENRKGFVYVLYWMSREIEVPFYIGETDGLSARMNNYCVGSFSAPTDFRVCECIRYFKDNKNCRVIVRYKTSSDRKAERLREEADIREALHLSGALLLNHFRSHNYRVDRDVDERKRLHMFCEASIRLQDLRVPAKVQR